MRHLISFLLLTAFTWAQGASFRDIYISVINGRTLSSVSSLKPESLRVKVGGKQVQVLSAERQTLHPRVAIVLDTSGSMLKERSWRPAFLLTAGFIQGLTGKADCSLIVFGDNLTRIIPSSVGPKAMIQELVDDYEKKDKRIGAGRTALLDAMATAVDRAELGTADALIVVSDGVDNHSHISPRELKERVESSGVRVFAFIFKPYEPQTPEEVMGGPATEQLSVASGGLTTMLDQPTADVIDNTTIHTLECILHPTKIRLALDNNSNGKLSLEYRAPKGAGIKDTRILAPSRLVLSHK